MRERGTKLVSEREREKERESTGVRVRGGSHKANRKTDRETDRDGSTADRKRKQNPRCVRAFPNIEQASVWHACEKQMKNDKEDVEGPPTYIAEKNTHTVSYKTNVSICFFKKKIENNNKHTLIDNHKLY